VAGLVIPAGRPKRGKGKKQDLTPSVRGMEYRIRPCTREDTAVLAETIRGAFRDVAERFDLTEENCPRHPSN